MFHEVNMLKCVFIIFSLKKIMCTFVNRRADPVTLFDHYVDRFCTEMNFEWAVLFNNSDILNWD